MFSQKQSLVQLIFIVISHPLYLGYNPLTRINNRHKCSFTVKVTNMYHISVNIIMNIDTNKNNLLTEYCIFVHTFRLFFLYGEGGDINLQI